MEIKKENGKEVIRNSDIKEAKKMLMETLETLKEGIKIHDAINDIVPIYNYKLMIEIENDIKKMYKIVDKIEAELRKKEYLKDTKILPSLTIEGDKIIIEIAIKELKRKEQKCERK